jgi:hypothetical protein
MSLKQVTMWNGLTKSEVKQEIYCPPGLQVSMEEFATELDRQAKADRLPAQIELCEVNWDDTNTKQNRILVRHTGNGASTDVLQFLVGVDQMGNYTYVEEKTFLMPPQLPTFPRGNKIRQDNPTWAIIIAIVSILIGISGKPSPIFLIIGLIAGIIAFTKVKTNSEVDEWNKQAEVERANWDQTWENWRKETMEVAYLSSTDDVFGRFTRAASSTVKQVIKKLFVDRQAELRRSDEIRNSQKEMEEQLEKRMKEFK